MIYGSWPLSPQPSLCEGAQKEEMGLQGPFGLALSACSGVWVIWELGLRWGLRELQVGCGPRTTVCRSEPQSVAGRHTPAGENGPPWCLGLSKAVRGPYGSLTGEGQCRVVHGSPEGRSLSPEGIVTS